MKRVELMSRRTCGSCVRVAGEVAPIVAEYDAELVIVDVDSDPSLAAEYGDRVPVVVVDGEEVSAWEVEEEELRHALGS